jgi:hypothetical protein
MTRVQIQETGRVVWADDDVARLWIATGYAVRFPVVVETASRTAAPQPARLNDTETR